jgi:hypothetical protein
MGEGFKRSAMYPGSVNHLRASMQRLKIKHDGKWLSADGQCLVFWEVRQTRQEIVAVTPSSFGGNEHHYKDVDVTPPTRGTWGVWLKLPNGHMDTRHWASIEAFEQPKAQETLIEFLDGRDPFHSRRFKPIGTVFEQFAQWIIDEARLSSRASANEAQQLSSGAQVAETGSGNGPLSAATIGSATNIVEVKLAEKNAGSGQQDEHEKEAIPLPDPAKMKAIWSKYTPAFALQVAKDLPKAYAIYKGGRAMTRQWGPTLIAEVTGHDRTRVSMLINALKKFGWTTLNGVPLDG